MFDLMVRTYRDWRAPREAVAELSRLSDAQLEDIGLTRSDIGEIARRIRSRCR